MSSFSKINFLNIHSNTHNQEYIQHVYNLLGQKKIFTQVSHVSSTLLQRLKTKHESNKVYVQCSETWAKYFEQVMLYEKST
jgi:hypothetical protein